MQSLGNVYIWGSPFVMSRTDAQNGVDIIFKLALSGYDKIYLTTIAVPVVPLYSNSVLLY
jgi:hypothetical protein